MSKYRGADGWMHDDGVTRRYKNKDDTKPGPKAPKQPEPDKPEPKAERPRLTTCPNCPFSVAWKRVEGYCDQCGWGKKQSDWDDYKPTAVESGDGALMCCGLFGASIIAVLVGMGMGYALGGWGGLLVGMGLGAVIPVGLIFILGASTSKKEKEE